MTRRFVTLDVFTGERFAGNPLAVVLEAEMTAAFPDAHEPSLTRMAFRTSPDAIVNPPHWPLAMRSVVDVVPPVVVVSSLNATVSVLPRRT